MAAAAAPAETAAVAAIGAGESRQQSSIADAQNKNLSLPSCMPGMEDIRAAHLSQARALESIVSALVSEQQSSIAALRRQMDAITSGQARFVRVSETKVGADANASVDGGGSGGDVRETLATNGANEDVVPKDLAETTTTSSDGQDYVGYRGMSSEQQLQQAEELAFLTSRVATLEKGMVKVQGMWDINKGHRVIELWMSILNKKSYKPADCTDPEECAVITLQNWWRNMLLTKLGWSGPASSSEDSTSRGEQNEQSAAYSPGSVPSTFGDSVSSEEMHPRRQDEASFDVGNAEHGKKVPCADIAMQSTTPQQRRPTADTVSQPDCGEQVAHCERALRDHENGNEDGQRRGGGSSWDNAEGEQGSIDAPRRGPAVKENETTSGRKRRSRSRRSAGTDEGTDKVDGQSTGSITSSRATKGSVASGAAHRRGLVVSGGDGGGDCLVEAGGDHMQERTPDDIAWPEAGTEERSCNRYGKQSGDHEGTSGPAHEYGPYHSHRLKSSTDSSRRCKRGSGGHHVSRPESEGGGSVQGMFDGALAENPVLLITSMAMQLQSLETEVGNLREHVESSTRSQYQKERQRQEESLLHEKRKADGGDSRKRSIEQPARESSEQAAEIMEIGRRMGELQRELQTPRGREDDRDRKNELSLQTLEALITEVGEESTRKNRAQAEANAAAIDKLLKELGAQGAQEKSEIVRQPLIALKLELRSMYASLAAIAGNEVSANLLRGLEGIRHLLTSVAERAKELEEEIGDPAKLARSIVAESVAARRFADMATDLGTTVFAFVKAQALQARRASAGNVAAVVAVKVALDGGEVGKADGDGKTDGDGSAGTSAPPEAWAKLSSLTYTRDGTGEKLPFPTGLAVLLQAIANVLNYCVGTGDLAIRLSVTLEDLTLYVAQRADKEREAVVRQLGTPIDSANAKLGEMEETLAGFQRTIHLVISEVDADRQRLEAIKALGASVEELQTLFARVRGELNSKAGALEIEAALEDMTLKINESASNQSRLQRLAHTLGRDKNSSSAVKRLEIELEQARNMALLALAPSNREVLMGSKCLSCNRPLGGFALPPQPKPLEEWYVGAGSLGAPKDRIVEATKTATIDNRITTGSNHGGCTIGGSGCGNIGASKAPGQTQPVMTPGKFMPEGVVCGNIGASKAPGQTQPVMAPGKFMPEGVVTSGRKGPILFERTGGNADPCAQGLKGRVLRGGGGPGAEGNVSISKYPRLVPLTAPKSAPATDKLYQTTTRGEGETTISPHRRRPSGTVSARAWSLLDSG